MRWLNVAVCRGQSLVVAMHCPTGVVCPVLMHALAFAHAPYHVRLVLLLSDDVNLSYPNPIHVLVDPLLAPKPTNQTKQSTICKYKIPFDATLKNAFAF